MRTKIASVVRLLTAAVVLVSLTVAATPYITTPKQNGYVRILPLPPGGTLHDILVRNGKPVGEQDPTSPGDPSVRILHGNYSQARDLFQALSHGGTSVPSAVGSAFRLPDGSTVAYYENEIDHGSSKAIGNIEIFISAKDVPVSQLRFYIPPSAVSKCRVGYCEGGGDM